MKRVGLLTGGGDCPGLNAVIRGVVVKCKSCGIDVFGFLGGWRGVYQCEGRWLEEDDVEGMQTVGGTMLESSRTNLVKYADGIQKAKETMEKLQLDCLIAAGGDDTLGVARKLGEAGINVVGVPKTIDNDLSGTDFTFGFDTSANIVMDALDKLHTTAKSHARVMVVEIMGRHTGWIAIQGGIAGDAHIIVIPEFPKSLDEICAVVEARKARGKRYTMIAVAEGVQIPGLEAGMDPKDLKVDDFGNVSLPDNAVAENLAKAIGARTGIETRHVVLGHLQRGGAPSAFDRVLGTRMGVKAAELAIAGDFQKMVALRGTAVIGVPIAEGVQERKKVDADLYAVAELFAK